MMKMIRNKSCRFLCALIVLLLGTYGCSSRGNESRITVDFENQEGVLKNCLQVVNYHLNTVDKLEVPDHLSQIAPKKNGNEFDVNSYFLYYAHLSMEDGYQLDYVYAADRPLLYARKINRKPIQSFDDFAKTYDGREYLRNPEYLKHVVIDNTAEGYMQMAILHLMGDQFYLSWHGHYEDDVVICNQEVLDRVLLTTKDVWVEEGNARWEELTQIQEIAAAIDLEPKIYASGQSIVVEIVKFTKWGGLIQVTYTIHDEFPHEFQNIEYEPIIEFNIGIKF